MLIEYLQLSAGEQVRQDLLVTSYYCIHKVEMQNQQQNAPLISPMGVLK